MEPENRDALRELQALKHKFKEHDRMAEKPSTLTPTPTRTRTLTLTLALDRKKKETYP